MPPRPSAVQAASNTPPPSFPSANSDAQDLLIVQDMMDTLDQIPPELTRVHSDLNELGAVLYTTLQNLETKMNQLINWIQDPTVGPEKRFQLLQEIAEEAARYKLGSDDKIRVAGGACDGIIGHQKHISALLAASTFLHSAPASPYTEALTLSQPPAYPTSRRGQLSRAANSPFGGRGYAAADSGRVGDTPTKKKKSRVQQLGREDDDASSVGGPIRERKVISKKRKTINRALSPADSLGSTSAFITKPNEPRTARQIAAAANRLKRAERDDSEESEKGGIPMTVTQSTDSATVPGLGLEFSNTNNLNLGGHSREGTNRSNQNTPLLANSSVMGKGRKSGNGNGSLVVGNHAEYDDDSEDEGDARPMVPLKRGTSGTGKNGKGDHGIDGEGDGIGDGEADGQLYCTCRQVSFGEMIGCDDDDCEIEWYHIGCVGFDKVPEGNWVCPACIERRKNNPKSKRPAKKRTR